MKKHIILCRIFVSVFTIIISVLLVPVMVLGFLDGDVLGGAICLAVASFMLAICFAFNSYLNKNVVAFKMDEDNIILTTVNKEYCLNLSDTVKLSGMDDILSKSYKCVFAVGGKKISFYFMKRFGFAKVGFTDEDMREIQIWVK